MSFIERPEVLLLSLAYQSAYDELFQSLFDKLHHFAQVLHIKTKQQAYEYLDSKTPRSILISDEALTKPKHQKVLDKVLFYARCGGVVVVGVHFPSFTTLEAFDKFFGEEGFGLPWRRGDYHRASFRFNSSCVLTTDVEPSLFPAPYSMKVLHVQNARAHEKIFVPVADAVTQSHVLSPERVDQTQAAVVGARFGAGHVFYIGDVNLEEESRKIILLLCVSESSSLNDALGYAPWVDQS